MNDQKVMKRETLEKAVMSVLSRNHKFTRFLLSKSEITNVSIIRVHNKGREQKERDEEKQAKRVIIRS